MKNLSYLIYVLLISFNLSAQTEKGNWFFGGDTSLSFVSSNIQPERDGDNLEKTTISNITFKPSANYFLQDNLAVGLGLLFQSRTNKEGSDKGTEVTTALLPSVTYFFSSGSKLVPYVGAGVGLMSLKSKDSDANLKYNGLAFTSSGGFAYFLSDSVSLNLGFSYLSSNLKDEKQSKNKIKTNAFGVTLGFGVFL